MSKLGTAGSVLAVIGLSASLAVTTSGTALADQEIRCEPNARVFTVQPNGNLWLFEHSGVADGGFAWSGARQIGTDWGHSRTIAGNFGYVYSITASGDFRRFRWNGDGWDRGGAFDVIGTGWGRFAMNEHRNKIAIDSKGDVYSIDQNGQLIRSVVANGALQSQVIAADWGSYDMIAASGPGTIYARRNGNPLHRFRYHAGSHRFYERATPVANTWASNSKTFGAGGGVLYGVSWVHEDLGWYRDPAVNDDAPAWQNGEVVGNGWDQDIDTSAATDTCSRSPEWGPTTPRNGISTHAPSALVEFQGKLRIAYRQDDGTIRFMTEDGEGSWSSRVVGQDKWSMDVSAMSTSDGVRIAAEHLDGTRTFTVRADGSVTPSTELGGMADELPVVVQNGTAYFSADGDLWYRSGEGPWRRKEADIGSGLTGITRADGVVVLVANDRTTTKPVMFTDDHGAVSDQQDLGGPEGLNPGLSLDGDGSVRVTFTSIVDEVLVTRRLDGNGSQDWVSVPGPAVSYTNAAAAAAGPDGRVDIVRRGSNGQTLVSTQVEPNGTAFGPWVPVGDISVQGPSITRSVATGRLVISFRDSANLPHVYKKTDSGYAGGKVG